MLAQVLAHIQFFGRIAGERICAGQVDDVESVVAVSEPSLLGVDGYAGVVADVLAGTGDSVEYTCLAAVGVADEGDVDDMPLTVEFAVCLGLCYFLRWCGNHLGTYYGGFCVVNGYNFDEVGLGAAQ